MKFCYFFHTIIFLLGWFSIGSLYAQNNQLRAYTLEDGLPQSQVYDVIQDEIGYLWLGTQGGGLCSFNGDEFKVWNEKDGLQSNYIHSLAFANDTLFIGTKGGLSIKTKSKFTNLEGPRINKIFNKDGRTYLSTNIGIYGYQKNQGLTKINLNTKINTSIISDIVYDGKLFWIATSKGLWKLSDIKKGARIMERHSAHNFTAAVFDSDRDKVYAAALNEGILVLNTNAKSYGNKWIPKPLIVNSISVCNENELWVATNNAGIAVIDIEKRYRKKTISRRNGLAVSQVRKIILDRQSNIWIATSGGGFYKYFRNNFTHYDRNSGLKGNRVYAIHTTNNEIWASNSEAGLIKIDSLGIQHIAQDKRIEEVKIKTITSDTNGDVWAGTEGKGILFKKRKEIDSIVVDTIEVSELKADSITVKTDTIRKTVFENHIIDENNGLLSNWVRTVVVDDNTIWAATYSKGIARFTYDPEKKRLSDIKNFTKNGIENLQINSISRDSLGRIWYTAQNGHLGYIWKNRVKHLGNVLKEKTAINNILFHNNALFIGTAGKGIWWSELATDKITFKKLVGSKRLYSDNIYQMIFDDQDNLWAGSERGVDKIVLNQSNDIVDIYHFGRNDGFLGIETCLNSIRKDSKGNLWFGAIYGLTKYKPTAGTAKETVKPKLFFEDVEVAYRSVDSINLNSWVTNNSVLRLTPDQTQLSFSFKTVDLDHPNDVKYRWRLNNTEWSPWSSDDKQKLAGLAYGAHSFTAQSRNYRWQEGDPVTFNFFIDSPIYEKTWFQWTVLIVIILIIVGYASSYIRRVKQKNEKEREKLEMQNHLLSLEQKALRLQMNPHFIFNALNGIKAMGTSNPMRMNTTINTFATLLRETLYNSRKDYITLDQEIKTLKHYIEIEKLMASKPFSYSVTIDSDLDPEEVLIPPMLIQPFVENAVRHGILKGERDGELKIQFHTTEDFLHCNVLDNGQGIFQSQKAKAQTDHQSMALTVTQERLESISGKDSLDIKEIVANGNTIAGTKITFKIPLLTDY